MRPMRELGWCWLLAVALLQAIAAQSVGQEPPRQFDLLTDRLKSSDAAVAAQAVKDVIKGVDNTQRRFALYQSFVPALMSAHRYDEVLEVTRAGILYQGWELRSLQALLDARIKALLIIGKNKEALAEAKALYNVCEMSETPHAVDWVAECLAAVYPDQPELAARFRQEQKAGAEPPRPSGDGAESAPPRSSVLDSIRIEYDLSAELPAHTAHQWLGRGNLLLMANRIQEARASFTSEMSGPGGSTNPQRVMALARCMKAEDGTTGRANAWLAKQGTGKEKP